ncbi:alpha/beta hydrolase family protein [Paenibacillus eucommiae]|uniref:Dienelactone hydrolase n=1 Tax=Paenibacillus eucommiae TaxID=1355755 RepID=A0ABS4IRB9_9BACL|nr:alpha/beta fold hydrolase [Paenibacillus eucommiae]MBP1990120.1 dienelactone hydrolase [Paenibacillus eucommiae]
MRSESVTEHAVQTGNRTLPYYLMSPDKERIHENPYVLLTFAMDWNTSLCQEPFCLVAQKFVQHGHYAISFDLPGHGARLNELGEEGLHGFSQAVQEERDPFLSFLEEAGSIIDKVIEEKLVKPGHIIVSGTSRGGYMALRLLAADARVVKGGAFAPVTDWNDLAEFSAIQSTELVNRLRLSHYIDGMINKPVFIAIGNHDTRVNTWSCCKFALQLAERTQHSGEMDTQKDAQIDFYCTDDEGHTMGTSWYEKGAEFLLQSSIQSDQGEQLKS